MDIVRSTRVQTIRGDLCHGNAFDEHPPHPADIDKPLRDAAGEKIRK